MKKIINIVTHVFENLFIFKKRFILTIIGVILSTVLLNFSFISTNYSNANNYIEESCFPAFSGLYEGEDEGFGFENLPYERIKYAESKINNLMNKDSSLNIKLYTVPFTFLNFPIINCNHDSYLIGASLAYGEEFSEADELKGTNYAIIHQAYAEILFPEINPLGQKIKTTYGEFIIKGVLKNSSDIKRKISEKNITSVEMFVLDSAMASFSDYEFVHYTIFFYDSMLRDFDFGNRYTTYSKVNEGLYQKKKVNEYSSYGLYIIVFLIATTLEFIVMLFNLKERYSEIGIKRAIGATKDDIRFELLLETFFIGVIGVVIGSIVSYYISALYSVNLFNKYYIYNSLLSVSNVLFTFSFVHIILFISCCIPSLIATNMNIVDVIKGE